MYYRTELEYLYRVFQKMHLQAVIISRNEMPSHLLNSGFPKFEAFEKELVQIADSIFDTLAPNTIYKLSNIVSCCYIYFLLPETPEPVAFVVGPYMTQDITQEQILESSERYGLPPTYISSIVNYFANVPVLIDESPLLTMINVFGETLWGDASAFEIVDVDPGESAVSLTIPLDELKEPPEDVLRQMRAMEERYSFENQLMQMVSQGHAHRAELMLSGFSALAFESRMSDPLRNIKNYGIICNTLLRKAAEQGGVHPIHLNRVSSEFARRIETTLSTQKGQELILEMTRSYCKLVRKQASWHYSPQIQKVVTYIKTDLSADLSLHTLAEALSINASYLSGLFKRETGKTITEFVNQKRMEAAAHLLQSAKLQIQTIAQRCGFPDVNYFSKVFKKHYGKTPRQYREEYQIRHGNSKK